MSHDLGASLRALRQSRGWSVPEMARQLRVAAKAAGDTSVPGNKALCTYIRRWERGTIGPSERYRLHYGKAFGIPPGQLGPGQATGTAAPGPAVPPVLSPGETLPGGAAPNIPPWAELAYRGRWEPPSGDSWAGREVVMAAHEGSDHAERAERRDIGDATLEQLRADLVRLSIESDTGDPFQLFLEQRRVRHRIYAALDRRLWPRDEVELYFLLGCLNGLMGVTADRLGYVAAAEELIRAGSAYATVIDHRPLLAQLHQLLSYIAYWDGRPRESRDLAGNGLQYLNAGPNGANLHLKYAQAVARLGNADDARRAIAAAHDAREREHHDELLEIGGEFAISRATHHYFASAALAEIDGAEREVAGELEQAAALYAAGPGPGEQYWFGARALTGIDLAAIRLRLGRLDGAVAVLEPVLALPSGRRFAALTTRFARVRAELAHARYQGSVQARALDERIEDFTRDTIASGLHELPGGPA
jgi:transcriptional regulator with XRE-family HTH domain